MGKIKKVPGPRRDATLSPGFSSFITTATQLPLAELPRHLSSFPSRWPFPRGDLNHWIPVLNRFDHILELFNDEYGLKNGPQTQPFGRRLLRRGDGDGSKGTTSASSSNDHDLDRLGFDEEGDKLLVEAILIFTHVLLENCGGRSLYSSSEHVDALLNSVSLSLVYHALRLALCLAQRYHASRSRTLGSAQHINAALLASHYSISLDKVQKLAMPFTRSVAPIEEPSQSTPAALTPKSKEKMVPTDRVLGTTRVYATDLVGIVKDDSTPDLGPFGRGDGRGSQSTSKNSDWTEWGAVSLTYYPAQELSHDQPKRSTTSVNASSSDAQGSVPSPPIRRPSTLSPQFTRRRNRTSESQDSPSRNNSTQVTKDDGHSHHAGDMKAIEISSAKVLSTPVPLIMASIPDDVPQETRYELLSRLRVAYALTSSPETREAILGIRILAITNLAYIYPEHTFQQKVLQQDTDEPRRLQLAYQLAELVCPSQGGGVHIPRWLQTLALSALEALAKFRTKAADVCAALNVNVNHGVLFYVTRKAIAELSSQGDDSVTSEVTEWRLTLFSVLASLPTIARNAGALVSPSLLPILLEVLKLRSDEAEFIHPKIIDFLNVSIHNGRDPLQTLANAHGLEILADLISFEVESSLDRARKGRGVPDQYRNQQVDYQVPFFKQQTLRRLFKFVNYMMTHDGLNLDRLLRNLMESPQLLNGLHVVLSNAKVFGSSIWSEGVSILSNFIHTEPTSYAVIAEAGLGKVFLDAVNGQPRSIPEHDKQTSQPQGGDAQDDSAASSSAMTTETQLQQDETQASVASGPSENLVPANTSITGVLPAADAIACVPHAFGAICLNSAGMRLFQESTALQSFFEIFTSPDHVRCMHEDLDLATMLGSSFDELIRHHPPLKEEVMASVMTMVVAVGRLCASRANKDGVGTRPRSKNDSGNGAAHNGARSSLSESEQPHNETVHGSETMDVVMSEADPPNGVQDTDPAPVKLRTSDVENNGNAEPTVTTYIDTATRFLAAFFSNTSACSAFIELGGAEYLLDLATLPSLPLDFSRKSACQTLARVIHTLAEQKPHLVLPSLIKLAQAAIDELSPFTQRQATQPFFLTLVKPGQRGSKDVDTRDDNVGDQAKKIGSQLVKSFVSINTLCHVLSEVFSQPVMNHRSSHTIFSQVNLTDMYTQLVGSLGQLHQACILENITLQKDVPSAWRDITAVTGLVFADSSAEQILGASTSPQAAANPDVLANDDSVRNPPNPEGPRELVAQQSDTTQVDYGFGRKTVQFANFQTLRYLFDELPVAIVSFLHGLGRTLIAKRLSDTYQKQNSIMVAEAIADVMIGQLQTANFEEGLSASEKDEYLTVVVKSLSRVVLDGSLDRPPAQCLTLLLQALKNRSGFEVIGSVLEYFAEEIQSLDCQTNSNQQITENTRMTAATRGLELILTFFLNVISPKIIVEASQTIAMASRDRDRDKPDYFSPNHFIVELRMAVVPFAQALWESNFVDKAQSSTLKKLIDVLRVILEADHEIGAYKRSDNITRRIPPAVKVWKEPADRQGRRLGATYSSDLVREALYRCNDNFSLAEEYCRFIQTHDRASMNPIPPQLTSNQSPDSRTSPSNGLIEPGTTATAEPTGESGPSDPTTDESNEQTTPNDLLAMHLDNTDSETPPADLTTATQPTTGAAANEQLSDGGAFLTTSIDDLLGNLTDLTTPVPVPLATYREPGLSNPTETAPIPVSQTSANNNTTSEMITVDDLNERRAQIREKLIDRCLDILNVHSDVTFELADLILASAPKKTSSDSTDSTDSTRTEIGETLVQSLMSLQMDDDFRPNGKKIAATAHLLALILRDKAFYEATMKELKDSLSTLLGFIKVFPNQSLEESSPWMSQILLLMERLLADDAQPKEIKWTPPSGDDEPGSAEELRLDEPIFAVAHKTQLFEAIIEILPRIGKDHLLAQSTVRVLVILTRDRQIATRLSEKRNLQRLFVMVKQLAGMTTGKFQSTFMLVLRHVIEDEETIRQIMRTGIQSYFESRQNARQIDTVTYVKALSPMVLRAPEIFVEISAELLKLVKYETNQRQQSLMLRSKAAPVKEGDDSEPNAADMTPAPVVVSAKEDGQDDGDKAAVEQDVREVVERLKPSRQDSKPPVTDYQEGIVHYLLCELLSYKDVEDKAPASSAKESLAPQEKDAAGDVDMTNGQTVADASTTAPPLQLNDNVQSSEVGSFKADQHPIFIYRCFILQCLSEILASYSRTKLEFINFARKAPAHSTPSKPKSSILSYLLNDLIPVGTLTHAEDVLFRKKYSTSNWAISTVVSLCVQTGEKPIVKNENFEKQSETESEMQFVRKVVLEHSLKAYKDAIASSEPLDIKYSRLLSLADLFHRMLVGRPNSGSSESNMENLHASQRQVAKLMFEKNFISVLTTSIAEIDLNFPPAKRAVKYILRPLKLLTQTAIEMSDSLSMSHTTGRSEDDVSSATSVSEVGDGREETPDLFRNSTLGMFEPGREADTSSDSSEEDAELYDDEYGDAMDYEEEGAEEYDDDDMSDEDEVLSNMEGLPGDVGVDVEVILGGEDDDIGSDGDDHDEDEDSDEDDMDGEEGMSPELNGSLGEDENGEWESDDADEYGEGHIEGDVGADGNDGESEEHHHHHHHDHPLEHIVRALEGDDSNDTPSHQGDGEFGMNLDFDRFLEEDMQEDEDLSDEDDEDDVDDDEEVIYDPGFDDGDAEVPSMPWGWDQEGDEPVVVHGHSHIHRHRVPGPWSLFSGGPRDPGMIMPTYRSHRPAGGSNRPNEDDTHPLLQRGHEANSESNARRDTRHQVMADWIQAFDSGSRGRGPLHSEIPASLITNLINAIGQGTPPIGGFHRHGGALHFHVSGPSPRDMPREIQAFLGNRRPQHEVSQTSNNDPAQAITFVPTVTSGRWQEEANLVFGKDNNDKTHRVINALLAKLIPPALEEERLEKEKKAAEEARKAEEEKARRDEEEREATRKLEEAKEQAERDEQAAANANVAEAETAADGQDQEVQADAEAEESRETKQTHAPTEVDAMEGVEATQPSVSEGAAEAGPSSAPVNRVRTTIRGRELDITGMDIDPDYLEALPEELREEVLMHQIAERRSQAASAGEQPTNISREFLEALPDDIREELLEQEAQDRRRREREEARRRAAANNPPTQPAGEDMDPASVLATLDPGLRQAILMEQDEDVLAQLPQDIAAEARALGSEHRLRHQFLDNHRLNRARVVGEISTPQDQSVKKVQRRTIVQMLDKAGVATLLRLMFIPQQGSARHSLNSILQNICENKQNRVECLCLLLSILQDGTADIAAIERSFTQLSLRARQSASQQKLSQSSRKSYDNLPQGISEISPLAVIQQCLSSLVLLVQYNPHIPPFFLTEHEPGLGLRRGIYKKGKNKESKAAKYPLNSLLALLDRRVVMESPTVMEQLSTLLNSVTQPLNILLRKDKNANPSGDKETQSTTATVPESTDSTAQPALPPGEQSSPAPEVVASAIEEGENSTTAEAQSAAQEASTNAASGSEPKKEENGIVQDNQAKKERNLAPPFIPEYNLCLVVNILTARECSAKTFRETLSTINSLSAIPGARDVFGMELVRQAQSLGNYLLGDLSDLLLQIQRAETDTDVQGLALAKFSPASSPQSKLLRVLTALDYLFEPKKENANSGTVSNGSSNDTKPPKGDVLATLSNDATFGPLWNKLSECLSAMREKEQMLNLATILLPLIEALMVVCKNTTLKSRTTQRTGGLEVSNTGPEQHTSTDELEDLFFKFTEEHRKILNDLVRQNPKLMSGTFSLLVKNPKVLEFDNKRNYFTRRLHSRGTEVRHSQPPLQLSVRRDQVFLDSFKSLYFKSGDEMKYGKLSIRFHGEEGVDAGGVTREWFQVLSRQMFNPDYALFTPVASDRTTFHPNRLSAVNPEHFMFFKFIGRIIGKALYEGRVLDCHFSRAVYKRILGKPVSLKDMETLDLDYYKSLLWMLENDITDIITETFSVETEAFGETQVIDLKENGRNIPVTESNKHEYVRLVVEYRLTGSVQEQLEHFLIGFHDIVPAELVSIFNEQELELLISGLPEIDVDDWKNNTEYHNYSASSPQIQWFWRAVRSFDKEERAKLLQFVTGTSKVPLNGFKELEGMNGFSRFNIHRDYGSKDRLPSSHTCFNQLDLPEYENYESLRQQVYTAITAGSEYFGFA